jgi:hypothetical protein
VFVLTSLLQAADGPVSGCFAASDKDEMLELVEHAELTPTQHRRLFFLQGLALSYLIFAQYRHGSYVSLAMKLRIDTGRIPLSLCNGSTSYLRMARDLVLQALVPPQYNDIGTVDMCELSAMSRQFVSRILSFDTAEFAWLSLCSFEKRTKTENMRLSELQETLERLHKLNPSKHTIAPITWIESLGHVLRNLLGQLSDAMPAWAKQTVARPGPTRRLSVPAEESSGNKDRDADAAAVPQPSSLDEPPSFLRDMAWSRPGGSGCSSSSFRGGSGGHMMAPYRQHEPVKCETPPPISQSTASVLKSAAAVGGVASSASKATPATTAGGGSAMFSLSRPAVRSNSVATGSPPVQQLGFSAGPAQLGRSTFSESFSAAGSGNTIPALQALFAAVPSAIKPLAAGERKELEDLRQLCGGGMPATSISQRSFRAWMDLELRNHVAEQRSYDLSPAPTSSMMPTGIEATRELVYRSLREAGASVGGTSILQAVAGLTNAQAKVFIQSIRGGS